MDAAQAIDVLAHRTVRYEHGVRTEFPIIDIRLMTELVESFVETVIPLLVGQLESR